MAKVCWNIYYTDNKVRQNYQGNVPFDSGRTPFNSTILKEEFGCNWPSAILKLVQCLCLKVYRCTINQLYQLKFQILVCNKSLTKDLLQRGVSQTWEVTLGDAPLKGNILLLTWQLTVMQESSNVYRGR